MTFRSTTFTSSRRMTRVWSEPEVYSPPPLTSVDPAITVSTPSLPVDTAPFSEGVSSPSSTTATSINMQQDCGSVSGPP